MKESYIKDKINNILNFKKNKTVKDMQRRHQIGRVINRMNAVIRESTLELESHLIQSFQQIAKEELKG